MPGTTSHQIRLSAQGRIVIPSELRRELDLDRGETLVARVEGERLVLEKRAGILQRLKARFRAVPADVHLSAELIADRRREAAREQEDG